LVSVAFFLHVFVLGAVEWLRAVSDNRPVAIVWKIDRAYTARRVQVAEALSKSGNKLVPDIVAGGADGKSGTLVDVLLAGLIRDGINNRTG